MSDCMTLDAFAAEEKYQNENLESTKDIVQSILNETLHSVVGNSEKVSDSKHIGDCNVAEEFLQYIPVNQSQSAVRKVNEVTEDKNNLLEEKPKEYKVLKEKALNDSELRIQNCKIHLETKGSGNACYNVMREETSPVKTQGRGNHLIDPVGKSEGVGEDVVPKRGQHSTDKNEAGALKQSPEAVQGGEKPFTPLTTEDLRQSIVKVWENINTPVLNGLDGELSNQPQGVMRLMEELSTLKAIPDAGADPNRPRACTLVEEDVKKMIKEIGEMNFNAAVPGFESITKPHEGSRHEEEYSNDDGDESREQSLSLRMESTQKESSSDGGEEHQEKSVHGHENAAIPCAHPASTFKSGKFNTSYDLEGNGAMFSMSFSESDEALIEASESVIQIIEPKEDSNDENEEKVTFSLLSESDAHNYGKDKDLTLDDYDQLAYGSKERLDMQEIPKVRSGMTTVGPVKNVDYDPKALTGPEVDYGKMTRISGSREMRRDSATDTLGSTESKKIYIDDGEDSPVIFFENGYMEFDTIVNHDIASMTKVQKVKEVLSDQPKSDEALRGEEKLLRSPLDLKDVDTYSCEAYNVIDLGVQLVSIDEDETNASKEPDESTDLSLFENNIQYMTRGRGRRSESPTTSGSGEVRVTVEYFNLNEEDTVTVEHSKPKEEKAKVTVPKNLGKDTKSDDHHQISPGLSCNKSVTQVNVNQNQKHNTIGRVFQKASNKFIMKDSDSFLRNSKSLPRDTSKITNTESFKSLLDDCQTTAVGVLKKSRSLVRNTQNVLKAVSKIDFGHTISGDKKANAASDAAAEQTESRQSTSCKNNGFLKLKETIKNKVGKKLKSMENVTSSDTRDRESFDNAKKPPPKSPLVCTNQLIQPCEEKNMEYETSATVDGMSDLEEEEIQSPGGFTGASEETDIEVICGIKFQGNSRCASQGSQSNSITDALNDTNSDQIDYVVMETVKGLDEDVPDSLEVNRTTGISGKFTHIDEGLAKENVQNRDPIRGVDVFSKSSSDKDLTAALDGSLGDEPGEDFADKRGSEVRKSVSTEKLRRKSKNLSARIRSFWQTAFGKVKTSPKKDVS